MARFCDQFVHSVQKGASYEAPFAIRCGSRSEERRVGKECRYWRDWSSDVCSSDLMRAAMTGCSKNVITNVSTGLTDSDIDRYSYNCTFCTSISIAWPVFAINLYTAYKRGLHMKPPLLSGVARDRKSVV